MEIGELHKRLKTTMVYVTHDQVEAMTMADKIVVLSAGQIEQVGSPLELYHTPQNLFVAGFIGSPKMNLIDGTGLAETITVRATGDVAVVRGERIGLMPRANAVHRFDANGQRIV